MDKEQPDAVMVLPELEVLYWAKNPFEGVNYITPSAEFASWLSASASFQSAEGHWSGAC